MSALSPEQQAEIGNLIGAGTDRHGTLIRQMQATFLRLAAPGGTTVAFGTGTWTWPGALQPSNVATITHNLGTTPLFVFICPNQDEGTAAAPPSAEVFSKTATTFRTRGGFSNFTPPAATTATFDWMAIG